MVSRLVISHNYLLSPFTLSLSPHFSFFISLSPCSLLLLPHFPFTFSLAPFTSFFISLSPFTLLLVPNSFISFTLTLILLATKTQGHEDAQRFFHSILTTHSHSDFCSVFCVLCSVFCVLCFVFCVLCFVFCVLCSVFCVLCSVFCVLCFVFCVSRLVITHNYILVPLTLPLLPHSSFLSHLLCFFLPQRHKDTKMHKDFFTQNSKLLTTHYSNS